MAAAGGGWGHPLPSFRGTAMRIRRHFTVEGHSPYEGIAFKSATSEMRHPDGSLAFAQGDIEVPEAWSQAAADVLAQKYFRKAGVPKAVKPVAEEGVPEFLWRKTGSSKETTGEHSAKQVFDRLAGTWTYWGWKGGYFDGEDDARAFYDELRHMLAAQQAAPNSPQWFNTGLHWAYGIDGPSQGHYYVDHKSGRLTKSASAYEHPQPHACFIQSVKDDLVNEGGIMDLWDARGAAVQIRLGHRHQFLQPARRGGKIVGRREIFRPDEFPEDRRPGRRRHYGGRHHPARRQDRDRGYRPPRHRGFH